MVHHNLLRLPNNSLFRVVNSCQHVRGGGPGEEYLVARNIWKQTLLLLEAGGAELWQTLAAIHLPCTPVACCQDFVVAVW